MTDQLYFVSIDSTNKSDTRIKWVGFDTTPVNPLKFTPTSTNLKIKIASNKIDWIIGDQIILENVVGLDYVLTNPFSIKKTSNWLKVNQPSHTFYVDYYVSNNDIDYVAISYVDDLPNTFIIDSVISDTQQWYIPKYFTDLNEYVAISNLTKPIGNLSTAYINKTHLVYPIYYKSDGQYHMDNNNWIVKLDGIAEINWIDRDEQQINISQLNVGGVLTSVINSNLYTITDVFTESDIMYIEIDLPYNTPSNISDEWVGGSNVIVNKIIMDGSTNQVMDVYDLPYAITNVKSVQMVSSIFPNSQYIITNTNSKFIWKTIDSPNKSYTIEIEPGNYDINSLIYIIQKKINATPLHQSNSDVPDVYDMNNMYDMYDMHNNYMYNLFDITYNQATSNLTFNSYKKTRFNSINGPTVIIPYDYIKINWPHSKKNILACFTALNNLTYRTVKSSPNDLTLKLDMNLVIYVDFVYTNSTDSYRIDFIMGSHNVIPTITYYTDYVLVENNIFKPFDYIITDRFENGIKAYRIKQILSDGIYDRLVLTDSNLDIFIYDDIMVQLDTGHIVYNEIPIIQPLVISDIMIIHHPNHRLNKNTKIYLDMGPQYPVNGWHNIQNIYTGDIYLIYLSTENRFDRSLLTIESPVNWIEISSPTLSSISFSEMSGLADLLGFNAIDTDYMFMISNLDKTLSNGKIINTSGQPYIYVCCPQLSNIISISSVPADIFTIINLSDDPSTILYDTYVPVKKQFNEPYGDIKQLSFSFYGSDNKPYDFNGVNYSFVLKFNCS